MTPSSSEVAYGTVGSLVTSHKGGFRCNVVIPDGARITGASATVRNSDPTGTVECLVVRTHLDVPTTTGDTVADIGSAPAQTGDIVLSTTTITNGVVNNARFSYRFSCALSDGTGESGSLGLFGGRVTYTVSALRG